MLVQQIKKLNNADDEMEEALKFLDVSLNGKCVIMHFFHFYHQICYINKSILIKYM